MIREESKRFEVRIKGGQPMTRKGTLTEVISEVRALYTCRGACVPSFEVYEYGQDRPAYSTDFVSVLR